VPRTVLAAALQRVGLAGPKALDLGSEQVIDGELTTAVQFLTGLVMVPGQFGLKVPLELLLRAMGQWRPADVAALFADLDVFRWYEDEVSNYEVGPRNSLEARLLVQARLGKSEPEVTYIKKLLLAVEEKETFHEDREINFAVELLRAVGPQSGLYFGRFFKELSDTLRELRTTRGITNPRVMLQEAFLLREWAVDQANKGADFESVDQALDRVEEVLHEAIETATQEKRSTALRVFMLTELATALASRARLHNRDTGRARRYFEDARDALLNARKLDPRNYYPVDVLSWATRDMLQYDVLRGQDRINAVVDLLHAFQTSDPSEFDVEQQERFHARRVELGDLLNIEEISEDAFRQLEEQGSRAGYYIRARQMSGLPDSALELNSANVQKLSKALKYLEENRAKVQDDARCLDLLLDLWWLVNAKQRFFQGERVALPFDQEKWKYIFQLVSSIEGTGGSHRTLLLRFLFGLSLFQLGDIEQSMQVFKEIESEAEQVLGRRRVIRSYVVGDASGHAARFHGTVVWGSAERNRGEIFVEELRRKLQFLPRDFASVELRNGSNAGEFHIAFNFLGPIADPLGRI
jgi:hypothetical protein